MCKYCDMEWGIPDPITNRFWEQYVNYCPMCGECIKLLQIQVPKVDQTIKYNMNQNIEFVLIDDTGAEVDWVDPVIEIAHTGNEIFVKTPFYTYEFSLEGGSSFLIRRYEEE